MTTASVTQTYRTMSSQNTRSPIARAISRSSDTATSSLWNTSSTARSPKPVSPDRVQMSSSGMPVIEPNRNCCSDPA